MESRQRPRPRRASRAKAVVVLGSAQFGVVGQVEPLARPAVWLHAWLVSLRSTCPTGWRNRRTACGDAGRYGVFCVGIPISTPLRRDSYPACGGNGFPPHQGREGILGPAGRGAACVGRQGDRGTARSTLVPMVILTAGVEAIRIRLPEDPVCLRSAGETPVPHVSSECVSGGGYFFRSRAACWRTARPLADSGSMSHRVCQLAAARSTSPMFWSASARLA